MKILVPTLDSNQKCFSWLIQPLVAQEKAAREEAEEEAELVRLSEGWSRARAVQLESSLAHGEPRRCPEGSECIPPGEMKNGGCLVSW